VIEEEHIELGFGLVTRCSFGNHNDLCELYNIHLDDESETTRHDQLKSLSSRSSNCEKCIIAGDFNQPYEMESPNLLYTTTLTEFAVLNNAKPTYNIEASMCIDNILTRNFDCLQCWCPNVAKTTDESFKQFGSDHIFVIAELI
jgi:endonuclease/exonuclease/phosphatase family metal-dependent hydrolase